MDNRNNSNVFTFTNANGLISESIITTYKVIHSIECVAMMNSLKAFAQTRNQKGDVFRK